MILLQCNLIVKKNYLLVLFDKLIYRWTVLTGTPELYISAFTMGTHQDKDTMYEFFQWS